MAMDDTDRQLIALLRKDARMTVATLAHKLGVSRGTVTNRLRKLEDEQVIVGYTLLLKPEAEPDCIRAWMGVLVEGNQTRQVIASLLGEPASRRCTTPTAAGICWPSCARNRWPSCRNCSSACGLSAAPAIPRRASCSRPTAERCGSMPGWPLRRGCDRAGAAPRRAALPVAAARRTGSSGRPCGAADRASRPGPDRPPHRA